MAYVYARFNFPYTRSCKDLKIYSMYIKRCSKIVAEFLPFTQDQQCLLWLVASVPVDAKGRGIAHGLPDLIVGGSFG